MDWGLDWGFQIIEQKKKGNTAWDGRVTRLFCICRYVTVLAANPNKTVLFGMSALT